MTDQEQDFLSMGVDPAQYEALERDFREVLNAMVSDKGMERFRQEYEKLHRALKTSYESEKRLVKRCKELQDTIVQNATRVKAAIKLTQEDSSTIGVLKKEVEKAWKLVELAKEKEEKARKIISELKTEIAHLHKIVEQGSGLAFSQDNTVQKLMDAKEEIKNELTQSKEQILDLTKTKEMFEERTLRAETELAAEKETVEKLTAIAKNHEEERVREDRKQKQAEENRRKLEEDLKQARDKTDQWKTDADKKGEEIKRHVTSIEKMTKEETTLKENLRTLENNHTKVHNEFNHMNKLHEQAKEKNFDMENSIERLVSQNKLLEKDSKKLDRTNKALDLDKRRLAEDKLNAINEKTIAKNAVSALTREIEWLNKQTENELQNIISLVRDRDKMKKDLIKVEKENQETKQELRTREATVVGQRNQLLKQADHIRELVQNTSALEKQRDKYCQEASKANANLMQMIEEVKLKKNIIGELKKENIEREAKYKQQQNLYEQVRSDRNLYSKNLIESQDEVAELRRKFKIAAHQIQQLKDEIENKDIAITQKDHQMGEKIKEMSKEKAEGGRLRKLLNQLEDNHRTTENEKMQYKYMLAETEKQNEASRKEYLNVVNERDILGTQLIRRNDELALLYEKIKILQTTLSKGEQQYNERLEDIKLLKYKIGDLKCELRIVTSKAAEIKGLKDEIVNLNKQLLTEKLQVKALSEELENPLNYHRWRKLEGTDPDTWEMLQKIQTLQKRLIKKTEEVVEKDVIIQEKEKLYVELKNLLARQPGPEVAEQLSIYQQNLKQKTAQMKAMAAELNMYQAQVNEYKYEIERLTRELQEMKRRYFEQKRREQNQREAQQKASGGGFQGGIQQNTGPQQRFVGGGFNLAI